MHAPLRASSIVQLLTESLNFYNKCIIARFRARGGVLEEHETHISLSSRLCAYNDNFSPIVGKSVTLGVRFSAACLCQLGATCRFCCCFTDHVLGCGCVLLVNTVRSVYSHHEDERGESFGFEKWRREIE